MIRTVEIQLQIEGKQVLRTTTTFLEPVRTEVNEIEIDETQGSLTFIIDLKKLVETLNREISSLRARIRDLESMLNQEKLTITKRVTEYEARIRTQTSEIQNLKADNSRAQSLLRVYQTNPANKQPNSSGEEQGLRSEIALLKKETEGLRNELFQKNNIIDSEKRNSDHLRSEIKNLRDEYLNKESKMLNEHSNSIQSHTASYMDQVQKQQIEIKRLNEEILNSHKNSQPLNSQLADYQQQIRNMSDELASSQSLQRMNADQLAHEKTQNKSLQDELIRLREQMTSSNPQVENLKSQIRVLQEEVDSTNERLREVRETSAATIRKLSHQLDEIQFKRDARPSYPKSESHHNTNSKTVIERNYIHQVDQPSFNPHLHAVNTAYIQETEAELARLRNQIMRLQNEKNQQSNFTSPEAAEYQTRINKLRHELDESQDHLLQETRKAAEIKKLLDVAESSYHEQLRQTDHFKAQCQELEWKLERADQQIAQLRKELKSADDAIDKSSRYSESEAKLKAQVELLSKDLQNKDDKISQLTHNYASLSTKYNEISESSSMRHIHSRDDDAVYLIKEENENLRKINSKLLVELNELRGENSTLRSNRTSYHQHGREYHELNSKLMFLESKLASDKENGRP